MKRKITFLLGFSLVACLMFTACDKDDETTPKEKVLYPVKITDYYGNVVDGITTFEYNANKQLVKKDYGDGFYYVYEYDSERKLIIINEFDDNILYSYDSLEYNANNQLIKIQRYNANGEKQDWYVLEYDAQGNVTKKSKYMTDGTVYSYKIYEHDSQGNMINQKFYWKDHVTGTILTDKYNETINEYDDKNNIHKSINSPFIWETHVNNIVKETYTEHSDGGESYSYTYTYTYNDDNYPIGYTEDDGRYVIEYQKL